MAVSTQQLGNAIGTKYLITTDADETADNDIDSTNAPHTVHEIFVDNTNNSDNPAYGKLYDSAAPTVGTTDPVFIVRAAKSKKIRVWTTAGLGHVMTDVSAAAVTTAGTAGTTGPTSAVTVKVRVS